MQHRTTRTLALAATVALAVTGLAACSAPPTADASRDPKLQTYYSQEPTWKDCADGMQCATVKAPLDYDNPGAGDDVSLALIRAAATGRRHLGAMLVNPGGPGGSGYDLVKENADRAVSKKVRSNYDLVGFDPRGVGRSSAIECYRPAQMDEYLFGQPTKAVRGSDEWLAERDAEAKAFAAACEKNSGDLLAHVDTASAARDMDVIRAALNEDTLDYLGYSYGTLLGATYADLFPDKVGRFVLDGAVDPTASELDLAKGQAQGFESALRAYLEDCLGNVECPFTGSVDDAMASVRKLLDSVDVKPITASDGRALGSDALFTAIATTLYSRESWEYLGMVFSTVLDGSADTAFRVADTYYGREDGKYRDNSTEAFTAVGCADAAASDDTPAELRAQAKELEAAAPVVGSYFAYGSCKAWPVHGNATPRKLDAPGAPQILVIGTTNDPATPYAWAKKLAEELDNGVLLTHVGEGHTAYNGESECINTAVDDYFVSGKVPAHDPKC